MALLRLIVLAACGALAGAAAALSAPAGGATSGGSPSVQAAPPAGPAAPAEPPAATLREAALSAVAPQETASAAEWGPPGGGLAASLAIDGDVTVGGKFRVTVSLRSAAGQAVPLPPAQDLFGWILVAQATPGSKKGYYSEKIYFARGAAGWPAELAGEKVIMIKSLDLSGVAAYSSDDGKKLLTAYVTGKADEPMPRPLGKLAEVLAPGKAMAKFTVCLPVGGAPPALVTSNAAETLVGPPDLKTLSPAARKQFEADLLKQFNRDAWSGQQAHDAAVRLGKEMLPVLIPAALEQSRPAHARLWLATALADIRDAEAADALIKLLDDPMQGIRNVVAYHGPKQENPRLDKAIVAKVQASKDAGLATWALLGYMVFRKSVPQEVLAAGIESDDPRARAAAAETLARHASDFNVARLVALVCDKDERVRSTAAEMLAKSDVRSPQVMGAMVLALDLPGEGVRQKICAALSQWTGQQLPYDPKADQAARAKTIAAWKDWWAKRNEK